MMMPPRPLYNLEMFLSTVVPTISAMKVEDNKLVLTGDGEITCELQAE